MSYTRCLYHIIFRTKGSQPTISIEHEEKLYRYVWGFCRNKKVFLHRIGGMPEHLHLLADLPADLSLAVFVRELKISTSHWLKCSGHFPYFIGWATGYAGLSYCETEKEKIIQYIKNQKQHHRNMDLSNEIRNILLSNGLTTNQEFFQRDWFD